MEKIKVGNAPCSWGALEFALEGETQGYQGVLQEMKETGYVGSELGDLGFMPTDPAGLRLALDTYKLDLPGAFVPVALSKEENHQKGLDRALLIAKLLVDAGYTNAFIILADENGSIPERTINAGRVRDSMSLDETQWAIFGKGVNRIAKAVKEKWGLRTVFHHHCAGYVETPAEVYKLLENTDPDLVGLCLDTGHYAFGGGDPLQVFEDHKDRIWHVHFKDYDPEVGQRAIENNWDYFSSVQNGVFCKLGEGSINFRAVLKSLKEMDYAGWIVVEQDVLPGMGSPKLCAKLNREFLQTIGI